MYIETKMVRASLCKDGTIYFTIYSTFYFCYHLLDLFRVNVRLNFLNKRKTRGKLRDRNLKSRFTRAKSVLEESSPRSLRRSSSILGLRD